jgi:hypothetical protein
MAKIIGTKEFCTHHGGDWIATHSNMLLPPSITCKVIVSAVAGDRHVVFVVSKNGTEGFIHMVLLLSINFNFLTCRK